MKETELKPCTCGGNAVKIKIFSHKRYKCDKCGWQTKVYVSPQGAKNAWNREMGDEKK
jgi:lipopolysaccharide biosynthesis regulator YciM